MAKETARETILRILPWSEYVDYPNGPDLKARVLVKGRRPEGQTWGCMTGKAELREEEIGRCRAAGLEGGERDPKPRSATAWGSWKSGAARGPPRSLQEPQPCKHLTAAWGEAR